MVLTAPPWHRQLLIEPPILEIVMVLFLIAILEIVLMIIVIFSFEETISYSELWSWDGNFRHNRAMSRYF